MNERFVVSGPEQLFALRQLDKFMVGHDGFIAGGCFKNLFNHEKIKDVDVFFEKRADFDAAVAYMSDCDDFYAAYESKKVRAFRHKESGIVAELVCSVFGTPEEILQQFDFSVVKFAYYKGLTEDDEGREVREYKAVYHPKFFEHLHMRRLVVDDQILFPLSTFERVIRYAKYGYTPCTETKQKVVNALRGLPEDDILVPTNFYAGLD